jgi:uncharacterized protein YbaP (TraB family)
LALSVASGAVIAATDVPQPILYRIQDASGSSPPGYLLGTMHSDDPRVLRIVDEVSGELETSTRLVLELVPDAVTMMTAAAGMMYGDGRRLPEQIPADLYRDLQQRYRERGLPEFMLERSKPWAVAITLQLPQMSGDVLDTALYRAAVALGLPVYGLETAEEQLAVFEALPKSEQIRLLRQATEQVDMVDAAFETMVAAYLEGDLAQLHAVIREQRVDWSRELEQWFEQRMLRERNLRMVAGMQPHLRKGPVLIAVGAMHLPGPQGILELLRGQGYVVSAVSR